MLVMVVVLIPSPTTLKMTNGRGAQKTTDRDGTNQEC